MLMGFCLMHLKISISVSGTVVKCMHYVAVSETQELICNSESEKQCVSDDSDITVADHLSEGSDNSVLTDQLWCDSRNEDRPKMYNFHALKPDVNCHALPHISADSSPLDCY
jgi:hypothetical protein